MDIIRPVFSDKNVAVRICYTDSTMDTILYHDKDCSRPLKKEEVLDTYLKGVVICDVINMDYFTPVGYIQKPTYSALIAIPPIIAENDEPTPARILKFKSEEIQLPG